MEKLDLGSKVYGTLSDPIRYTAANLINCRPLNVVEKLNLAKAESSYHTLKREPLGSTYNRDHTLPSKFSTSNVPFGKSSRSDEPAKQIIFPQMDEEAFAGEDIYRRSHGSYQVGEQKRRNYDWKINPNEMRFGVRGDTIAFNGVSKNITEVLTTAELPNSAIGLKIVEDFRSMRDEPGKPRVGLGSGVAPRPENFVYGLPSSYTKRTSKSQWNAADTIMGKYAPPEQQTADFDLGKSITPGFRNISQNVKQSLSRLSK